MIEMQVDVGVPTTSRSTYDDKYNMWDGNDQNGIYQPFVALHVGQVARAPALHLQLERSVRNVLSIFRAHAARITSFCHNDVFRCAHADWLKSADDYDCMCDTFYTIAPYRVELVKYSDI